MASREDVQHWQLTGPWAEMAGAGLFLRLSTTRIHRGGSQLASAATGVKGRCEAPLPLRFSLGLRPPP